MQLVARSLFRFRVSATIVAFALVWAAGATSVAGVVFWFVAAVAGLQVITVVRDCWDIWAARAQKVNGWHSCALTSRNTTQMRWDCGPWPWG